MFNITNSQNMSPEGVSLVIAGVAAAVASIVYSLKNVKHSECCCIKCDQKVLALAPVSKDSITEVTQV